MTDILELAKRVEALKSHDVQGHMADTIQDMLRVRFGLLIAPSDAFLMADGAIAALRATGGTK